MILRFLPSALFTLGGVFVWLVYELMNRLGGLAAGDGAGYHGGGGPWIFCLIGAYFTISAVGALPFVRHPLRVGMATVANSLLGFLFLALCVAAFSSGAASDFGPILMVFLYFVVFFGPFSLLWRWLLRRSAAKEQPPA